MVEQVYLIKNGTQTSTTPPDQSESGSNSNEGVHHITESSSTGASRSDDLVSYPEHSLVKSLTPLQRCSRHILQPQPTEL